jgi:hypothetical protein
MIDWKRITFKLINGCGSYITSETGAHIITQEIKKEIESQMIEAQEEKCVWTADKIYELLRHELIYEDEQEKLIRAAAEIISSKIIEVKK